MPQPGSTESSGQRSGLFGRLFSRTRKNTSADEAFTPAMRSGHRVYCVGDIHGRLDLLQELHQLILDDANGYPGTKSVVYLGDYIDRGPQSREVLDLLIQQPLDDFDSICLLGNHERAMLDFLQHPEAAASWLSFGGQATLTNYGVGQGRPLLAQPVQSLSDELRQLLPAAHLAFLESLALYHVEGDYCFVHAGIRPGRPIHEQSADDLVWIREDFTRSTRRHSHVVVHGHSITQEVEWQPNRIGIDTGAYLSGRLTALVLEETDARLLQTGT
jgi:serine/threonine protein phosphatase 1